MRQQTIPASFARTIGEVFGARGVAWLAALPALLDEYAGRWGLTLGAPFNLSYNYVLAATRADGTPAVLKLGVPNPELSSEAAALRHYAGRGCARLLEADVERGALLIERLLPGSPLSAVADDEQATASAAGVMRALWRPPPDEHQFPTTARWGAGFARLRAHYGGGTGPLPAPLVAQAERLFAELQASAGAPALLHGDLHHGNILATGPAGWLAIDPKGVVGEPAYEVGTLLRNPIERVLGAADPAALLARRVDILAGALGLNRRRLIGWGLAQAVLSAWWSIEDHGHGWQPAIALAEHLATI